MEVHSGLTTRVQIAGATGNCTTPFHAVRWDENGNVQDLGNLGGTVNVAQGINNLGHVVGGSNLTGDATNHAFLWTEDKGMQDLGTVSGDFASYTFSVNDKDQVIGTSSDQHGNFHAFLWQDGVMTDLNKVIQHGFPLALLEAFDINNRGEIVGLALDPNTDETHAFLATPYNQERDKRNHCRDESTAVSEGESSERP